MKQSEQTTIDPQDSGKQNQKNHNVKYLREKIFFSFPLIRNDYNYKTDLERNQVKFQNKKKLQLLARQQNSQKIVRKLEYRSEGSTHTIVHRYTEIEHT